VSGVIFVLLSIFIATDFDVVKAGGFIDYASVMITIGGTIASTFIAFPLQKVIRSFRAIGIIFTPPKMEPTAAISNIVRLANIARKEGILSLEETVRSMDDIFLQKGVMLVVDGTDPELTRSIMETELAYIDTRHSEVRGMWEFIGTSAPSWGMIGTLIGLIIMLTDLSDPSTLGPKMAVALVTTFYGSILANFIANPVASKLKILSAEEFLMKEVLIEGILSIQAGENPRIIEEKLKSFLSPGLRSEVGNNPNPNPAGDING
jgi:chemotaxis protein MotA